MPEYPLLSPPRTSDAAATTDEPVWFIYSAEVQVPTKLTLATVSGADFGRLTDDQEHGVLLALAAVGQVEADEKESGFVPMFNGKDLSG
jgi:hypothetical protein